MKALLVYIVFAMNPNGSMTQVAYEEVLFESMEVCNEAGRSINIELPANMRSISVCVSEASFNETT